MKTAFKNIQLGAAFWCNGNYCIKRSSRTADIYGGSGDTDEHFGRFYFGQSEVCYSGRGESSNNPPRKALRSAS